MQASGSSISLAKTAAGSTVSCAMGYFRKSVLPSMLLVASFFVFSVLVVTEGDALSIITAAALVLLWFFPSVAYGAFFSLLPVHLFIVWDVEFSGPVVFWLLAQGFAYYTSVVLEEGDLSMPFSVSAVLHVVITFPFWGFSYFLAGGTLLDILQNAGLQDLDGLMTVLFLPSMLFMLSWVLFVLLFLFRRTLAPSLAFVLLSLPFVVSGLACRLTLSFVPGPPLPS